MIRYDFTQLRTSSHQPIDPIATDLVDVNPKHVNRLHGCSDLRLLLLLCLVHYLQD